MNSLTIHLKAIEAAKAEVQRIGELKLQHEATSAELNEALERLISLYASLNIPEVIGAIAYGQRVIRKVA